MKRVVLALLLGSVFTIGCGQRLVDLPPDDDGHINPPPAPVLTSILPQRGAPEGGTSVVLTGTNLNGATEVAFGSVAAASFTVNSSTQVTAVSPAGTGSVNVTVTTAGGRSNGLPFAYGNAPVITGITPAFGLAAGGETVTITGSVFTGASSVTFGGTAASAFTVDSDSQITVTTPAHAAGTVEVVVTTSVAASNGFNFTYGEAPTVTSIAPAQGSTAGGTVVTLTGTNLTSATQVSFDTTTVTTITVVDDEHITVATPAHAAGDVSVTVTTPFGTSTAVTFTYGPAPTLASATPNSSPITGGDDIVLAGTNLTGASVVLFGSVEAEFTVDSDTQITAVSPPGTSSVNITVTTPFGTSNILPFGYGDSPIQTSLNPSFGLVAGGTTVIITGEKFTALATVTFGGVDATAVTVDSATQMTVTAPAHAAGTVDVQTTTPDGTSNVLPFTYGAAPTLTGAAPNLGSTAGGTSVVLTGTDLTGTTAVAFGATAAAAFTVDSATQITATSPAGVVGDVQITATTQYGTSNGVTFTYGETPVLTSLSPAAGDVGGGTTVVIDGTALDNATGVFFGATAATSYVIDSPTQITAVSPAGTDSVNVSVTSLYGTSNTLVFAYANAPTITALTPNTGSVGGGETVTITGTNFSATSTVLFASAPVTPTFVSATELTVTAPAHSLGAVSVTVTTDGVTSNAATYTYGEAPTIASLNPTAGSSAGNTTVTITGTGFIAGTTVSVAAATISDPIIVDSTTLTFVTPAHAAGAVDVAVTTPFGTSGNLQFTYIDPPTITDVTPATGGTSGGTTVTITGTNFLSTTDVTFDGTPANVVTITDTALTVTTPAHSVGTFDVVVTTLAGSATLGAGFTYAAVIPTISAITPNSGLIAGGTTLTITGTGFFGVTAVNFDGVAGTSLDVLSDTSLMITTPAHAAGAVDVVVQTAAGSATEASGYTYVTAVTPGTITGASDNPGILSGTGLAWLGTDPGAYAVFSCPGLGCNINQNIDPAAGPITDTAFTAGAGEWTGFTGAICPAGTTTWNATDCTNQWPAPPPP